MWGLEQRVARAGARAEMPKKGLEESPKQGLEQRLTQVGVSAKSCLKGSLRKELPEQGDRAATKVTW